MPNPYGGWIYIGIIDNCAHLQSRLWGEPRFSISPREQYHPSTFRASEGQRMPSGPPPGAEKGETFTCGANENSART